MARSSVTGRYIVARPRLGGSARRPRVKGADYSGSTEVDGVVTGKPIELGGPPEPEPKTTTKAASSSA